MTTPTVTISRERLEYWLSQVEWRGMRNLARSMRVALEAQPAEPEQGERAELAAALWMYSKEGIQTDLARQCQREAAALLQSSQPEPAGNICKKHKCLWSGNGCPHCAEEPAGELPPLPEPDGVVEIDEGPNLKPNGREFGRLVSNAPAWSEQLVKDYARAAIAQSEHSHLQDIASTIGVGGYNGATTEQLVERIQNEFTRLHGLLVTQSKQVPDGYALVPVAPTNEMTSAMADALEDPENERSSWDLAENMYVAMLAAAPQVAQPLTNANYLVGCADGDCPKCMVREPLTELQIHERYKALRGAAPPKYIEIYRDAEAAHGIGAAPQTAQPQACKDCGKDVSADLIHTCSPQVAQPQAYPNILTDLCQHDTPYRYACDKCKAEMSQPQASEPEIDCRQCAKSLDANGIPQCIWDEDCTNGDKFTKLEPVQLYRRGV